MKRHWQANHETEIAQNFDEQKFRSKMRLLKEKFLISQLKRRADMQFQSISHLPTDSTHKQRLIIKTGQSIKGITTPTPTTTTTTTSTTTTSITTTLTTLPLDSKLLPSPSSSTAASSSSHLLDLLAGQGPQVHFWGRMQFKKLKFQYINNNKSIFRWWEWA